MCAILKKLFLKVEMLVNKGHIESQKDIIIFLSAYLKRVGVFYFINIKLIKFV